MHSSILAIFLSAITATALLNVQASTFNALSKRQSVSIPLITCSGFAPSTEPNPCEYICGEGSRQCVNDRTCFNPTKGETCCENGTYCPAGSYCSNIGCCDEGLSLEECGAVRTIGTLPGDYFETSTSSSVFSGPTPYETTTSEEAEGTFTPSAYESTSAIIEPSPTPYSSSSSSESVDPTSYSPPVYPTSASPSIDVTILPTIPAYPSSTTSNETDTNATLQSYTPAQQTTNAGFKHEVAGWTIGGMAALVMGFFL